MCDEIIKTTVNYIKTIASDIIYNTIGKNIENSVDVVRKELDNQIDNMTHVFTDNYKTITNFFLSLIDVFIKQIRMIIKLLTDNTVNIGKKILKTNANIFNFITDNFFQTFGIDGPIQYFLYKILFLYIFLIIIWFMFYFINIYYELGMEFIDMEYIRVWNI